MEPTHKGPFQKQARPAQVGMSVGEGGLTCRIAARLCQLLQGNQGPMPTGRLVWIARTFQGPWSRELGTINSSQIPQLLKSTDKHSHLLSWERKKHLEMELERWRGKEEGREREKNQSFTWKTKGSKEMSITGIWEPGMHYQSRCKTRSLKAIFAHHSLSNPTPILPLQINWVERGHALSKWEKHRCIGGILKESLCLSNKY